MTTQVSYDYDVLGNLRFRSDVGTLEYRDDGVRPHAVNSVTQTGSNVITENVYNPYGNYSYDANGNLTQNGQRSVDWTGFNKPKTMKKLVDDVVTKEIDYTYGSDFQRISKSIIDGMTTLYFGGGSMEHITENDQTYYKYYIPVGAATLEVKYEEQEIIDENNNVTGVEFNQVEKHYLFKDHLGSTDVIVDNDGNIVEHLSFNPWGERRKSDWNEATDEIVSRTNRGFTGHEMDDEIGLINMNARIYDPVIGRFLSPDGLIPSPTDLQSYNRYSYVRNNPLSFVDPTGFAREDHITYGSYKEHRRAQKDWSPKPDTSHIISFPGNSGHFNSKTGKFYQQNSRWVSPAEAGGGKGSGYWEPGVKEVTDPGQKKAIAVHLQVGSEIIQNYGGLSRGNSKETRNKYRGLAAAELAANGHTALYQDYLDRAYAADQIYKALKRKAKRKYGQIAAVTIVTAGVGKAFGAALGATGGGVATGAFSGALSGDPKAALIGAATGGAFGQFGINPETLISLDTVKAIGVHAAIGCASSAAGGGSCSKGAAAQVTSKLITVGFGNEHSVPKLVLTIAAGGLINGSEGAITSTLGYLFNHEGQASRDERIAHQRAHEGGYLYDGGDTSGAHILYAIEKGFAIATILHPAGGWYYTAGAFTAKWFRSGFKNAAVGTGVALGLGLEAHNLGFSHAMGMRFKGAATLLMPE